MFNGHKVVVTMTSWTKRIGNCYQVVKSILNNTMKPDEVYLNLSVEEFPNKEEDLPKDLVQLAKEQQTFDINWVEGSNTKTMKKVFPILPYVDDEDLIITIDDDIIIPKNLVKLRVDEFFYYDGKFAVSGASNPRWHLNKPLFHTSFNMIALTSIFQKKMLAGYQSILSMDLIRTYNDDCIYSLLITSNGYGIVPSKKLSTPCGGLASDKLGLKNEISPMRGTYSRDEDVIKIFSQNYDRVMQYSFKDSLFNFVVWDSATLAADNGEYFYRKCSQKFPFIKMTFLLDKSSKDWQRLEKDGFNLCSFDNPGVEILLQRANFILFSKDVPSHPQFCEILKKYRNKGVFLDHGITSKIYDIGFYITGTIIKYAAWYNCTSEEENMVVKSYSKSRIKTLVYGHPRHDCLLEKYNRQRREVENGKTIFITFHWRKNLNLNSQYFCDINAILNDSDLRRMVEKDNVKVYFLPHAKIIEKLKMFKVPKYINIPTNIPFQDILVKSDVLVTDFSSNSFEMAYMGKPSVIFIPDAANVSANMPRYHINKLDYPQMIYCSNRESVIEQVESVLKDKSGKFSSLPKKLFKYVDTNNTQRLVEWMLNKIEQQKKQGADSKPDLIGQKQKQNDFRRFQFG